MNNQSSLNISVRNLPKLKQEIYNQFSENQQKDEALYKATQQNYKDRQVQRLKTPLYQTTNLINNEDREIVFKASSKKTQFSDQKSLIFEFGNQRDNKEIEFKPSKQQVKEPGQNSDQIYKQQLKTSDYPNRNKLHRNPISDGDPKSEYVKQIRVKEENMPKTHIKFG